MVDLLIINKDFDTTGSQLPHQHSEVVVSSNENDPKTMHSHNDDVTCNCPPRSKVPDQPNRLPFEAANANVSKKMGQGLLYQLQGLMYVHINRSSKRP